MRPPTLVASALFLANLVAPAAEFHVSPAGDDSHPGSAASPLRTISAAAAKAMPGDTVTVHEGVYLNGE